MPTQTFINLPDEKREQLLNFAVEEFAANPYSVASMSNIVRRAGIPDGSFYQYFNNKKDLYRYLIEIGTEEKLKLLNELPAPDPSSDLFSYIRWLFLSAVSFELRHPLLAKISYRAFVEEVPFPKMTEELQRRGTTQFFKQLISQGLLHGSVASDVDPDVAAFLMETVFYQFGLYFINRLNLTEKNLNIKQIFQDDEAQQILNNLMDILEHGMKRVPNQ